VGEARVRLKAPARETRRVGESMVAVGLLFGGILMVVWRWI
jgi:hypothetical protein